MPWLTPCWINTDILGTPDKQGLEISSLSIYLRLFPLPRLSLFLSAVSLSQFLSLAPHSFLSLSDAHTSHIMFRMCAGKGQAFSARLFCHSSQKKMSSVFEMRRGARTPSKGARLIPLLRWWRNWQGRRRGGERGSYYPRRRLGEKLGSRNERKLFKDHLTLKLFIFFKNTLSLIVHNLYVYIIKKIISTLF